MSDKQPDMIAVRGYHDPFVDDFDPGMPTTCRCGRTVDLSDMVDAPEGDSDELVCRQCGEGGTP